MKSHSILPFLVLFLIQRSTFCEAEEELLLMTVATDKTDAFLRYIRSAEVNKLKGKVLGMGEEWKGGDMNHPGGAFKINLLKREMANYKDKESMIVMFTDSYDVILLGDQESILSTFHKLDAKIVFGAENFCWPDKSLKDKYPEVLEGEKRYLNSGGFIGYAKDIYEVLNYEEVEDRDDDQLYYTKIFLNNAHRNKHKIKLDTKSEIFHNLNGAIGDVKLQFENNVQPYLQNIVHNHRPLVLHGNGPSKLHLNTLGNYIPKAWNSDDQCTSCWENTIEFGSLKETPEIVLAIFIEQQTPFIEEFFQKIKNLDYPKEKIDLFIHNSSPYHKKHVQNFLESSQNNNDKENDIENHDMYHSIEILDNDQHVNERLARNAGIQHCLDLKCDFYFSVDSVAHIDNEFTLKLLIEQNRDVISPLMIRAYHAWSNFWGALNDEGYYARSMDYMDIVQGKRHGLWNVPFISSIYLIKGEFMHNSSPETRPNLLHESLDADMALCRNLRDAGVFFYVSNRAEWGHLVNADSFKTDHLNNELWEMETNKYDWELRYIHPDYSKHLEEGATLEQPCPDVYQFPIVTKRFTKDFVSEMENYGKWSNGSNQDTRLEGGYENVPTRDIHMNQVGYEKEWLTFLDVYVRPLQEAAYIGYFQQPPKSIMNFVVKYKPDEQASLRPHHDSSTFTINIALNEGGGVDYEGGGCRFIRYNCSVLNLTPGWMLMHPGRLTHYHEGLLTTQGTRYIMISFVNP